MQTTKSTILAVIREAECIGCTKCIAACPVDAILGSAKHMHTVIADECIGCQLCIPPCPVDCIDLVTSTDIKKYSAEELLKKSKARARFQARKMRLLHQKESPLETPSLTKNKTNLQKKKYLAEAIQRVKDKRLK